MEAVKNVIMILMTSISEDYHPSQWWHWEVSWGGGEVTPCLFVLSRSDRKWDEWDRCCWIINIVTQISGIKAWLGLYLGFAGLANLSSGGTGDGMLCSVLGQLTFSWRGRLPPLSPENKAIRKKRAVSLVTLNTDLIRNILLYLTRKWN